MLPFLKKKEASVSMPADVKVRESDHEESYDPMESAMEDLCHAEERKDYAAMADAFRAAFELLESQPHEEYHEEGEE
jgi:hypothetical protein